MVRGESLGLLGEVVALDLDTLTLEPVEIGGDPRQGRIDRGAADPGRAAHRGVIKGEFRHGLLLMFVYRRLPIGCGVKKLSRRLKGQR